MHLYRYSSLNSLLITTARGLSPSPAKYSSTCTLPRQTRHRPVWTLPVSKVQFFFVEKNPSVMLVHVPWVLDITFITSVSWYACDTPRDNQELSTVTVGIFRISSYAAALIRVCEAEWIGWLFICCWGLFAPLWGSMERLQFHLQRWQTQSTL